METNLSEELRAFTDCLYFVGGKWRLPIISSLCKGNKRFREIERSIAGINTRMLSKELKEMEMNKLLTRSVDPDFPSRVEYVLTPDCRSFIHIITAMIDWGKQHRKTVTAGIPVVMTGELQPLSLCVLNELEATS